MAVNNPSGGRMPANTVLALPPLIEDEPTEEFKEPYTIIMPNGRNAEGAWLTGNAAVRMYRQFNRGKCVVYDPKVAWGFINDLGYKCEPMPPAPPPMKPRRQPREPYVRP